MGQEASIPSPRSLMKEAVVQTGDRGKAGCTGSHTFYLPLPPDLEEKLVPQVGMTVPFTIGCERRRRRRIEQQQQEEVEQGTSHDTTTTTTPYNS